MIVQNLWVVKGESKTMPFEALNSSGGVITLADATSTVTMTIKTTTDAVDTTLQKRNTYAGGNDNEIEVTTAASGEFVVKFSSTNTTAFTVRNYSYTIVCYDGTDTYTTHAGALIVQQSVYDTASITRKYGTTAQRPTLTTADIGFEYYDTTIGTPIWWSGSAWG